MKYSQFNTIVAYEDKFALFNSFTQKVMFLEEIVKDLLEAAKNENIDDLKNYHPTFYDYLIQESFLVENDLNEVEVVKNLSNAVDNDATMFFLTINPTMNCNFKCWYCYETHIATSKLGMTMIKKINNFVDLILSKPQMKFFNMSFFGGEPLLYFKKDVQPLIEHYVERCREKGIEPSISFTSNGYLINDDFFEFFNKMNIKCTLQITLDGHEENHNKIRYVTKDRGSYSEIVENVKRLVMNDFFINLRINYTNENLDDAKLIANEFVDLPEEKKLHFLKFDFHRVWQDSKADKLEEKASEYAQEIRGEGIPVTSGHSADNVRNSCYADKRNSVVINYNGDLYKCTARDFTPETREGFLGEDGSMNWENDALERRMNVKFKNKPCLSCKIMPLCNGGCSQHALDNVDEEYCVFRGDEREKDFVVKSKIEEILSEV